MLETTPNKKSTPDSHHALAHPIHRHAIWGVCDIRRKSLFLKHAGLLSTGHQTASTIGFFPSIKQEPHHSLTYSQASGIIRVLLIEDEPGDANLVFIALRDSQGTQFKVTWTSSLGEAKEQLAHSEFDIILLDLSLPDSWGLETVNAAQKMAHKLPFIVLTGRDDVDFAISVLDAGAADYLTKGDLDRGGLARIIRYTLHRTLMEARLAEKTTKLTLAAQAIEAAAESIIITDANGVIESVNPAFTVITGYSEAETIGKTPRLLQSGLHNADFYRVFWNSLKRNGCWQGEMWNQRKNGDIYPQWLSIRAVRNPVGNISHYVAIASDLTLIREAERHAERLGNFDALTDLPNRDRFSSHLTQAISSAKQNHQHIAVLVLNLRRFREINEARGMKAGDDLLMAVACRLRENLHKADSVSRLGADEFAVLLTELGGCQDNAASAVLTVAERLLETLKCPFKIAEQPYSADARIGISLFCCQDEHCNTNILGQAQTALNQIKNQPHQRIAFFEQSMGETALNRYTLQQELHVGIADGQLRLYLQAQVDDQGGTVGFEALVRWQHPQRGMIAPVDFIPLAEESDLIIALDNWILEQACHFIVQLTAQGRAVPVAINLSPRHFANSGFVADIRTCLSRTGVDPALVILEVTEGLFLHNTDSVAEKMRELVNLGLRFSLDDFGTGYSSLSYLKHLPLYELKIDRSFISGLPNNSEDSALVEAILAVARTLQLHVVAEGVETAEQSEYLRQRGPVIQQGYFFGKPEPAQNWLERLI